VRAKKMYDNDAEFRLWCKMIVALAFVPLDQLDNAFNELSSNLPEEYEEELSKLLDWLEDAYLGRIRGGSRRKPMFPPEIW